MNDLERVLDAVSIEYGQERHALLAGSRGRKDLAEARQVAMYLAVKVCPSKSLTTIGLFFGRDRTTVRHSVEKITKACGRMSKDLPPLDRIKRLEVQLVSTIAPV